MNRITNDEPRPSATPGIAEPTDEELNTALDALELYRGEMKYRLMVRRVFLDFMRNRAALVGQEDWMRWRSRPVCADGQLPDGPVCPKCGGVRAPSGVDGGTWVHIRSVPAAGSLV